ncbi:YciI family protein [Actinophytocola sp.]|uniref:YciI family protein n=1 Tax=Actinophytocola sp. TaxID=1872138 RepID=UPI002ED2AE62
MIVLELAFDDDPRRLEARPAHRERLAELHANGTLVLAGPWADDSGALLVFDAEMSEVDKVMTEDPYYTTEGVRVLGLREWRLVVS